MKRMNLLALIVLIPAWAFSQSQLTEKGNPPAKPGEPSAAAKAALAADPSYTIGPEDVISIAVWREPDFSITTPVRPDGKVALPLIGDVQAAGKTPALLSEDLTVLLKKYVEQPRVTVMVTSINSRRVYLLGEISRPGPIAITPGMTVLQAIAAGGGLTPYANSKKIYVLRTEGGAQSKLAFNYKEALKGTAGDQNVVLKSGDTIVVP